MTPWSKVCEISRTCRVGVAIDVIFDEVDDALITGKFDEVNDYLLTVELKDEPPSLWLSLLTVTLPWKKKLPARAVLYQEVVDVWPTLKPDLSALLGLA